MDITRVLNLPRHNKPCLSRGKHKHEPIEDVPTDYLQWVVDTWSEADPEWEIAANELYSRFDIYG
jgi:hypothetical protein